MKTFIIYRSLKGQNGTLILHTLGIAAKKEVADELAEHAQGFLDELKEGKIVVNTPEGPRAVMSVAQFLVELGIMEIGYASMSGEAKETNLVAPRSVIHLQ